jgi:D-3-phosphoglycerate dehydrogenase
MVNKSKKDWAYTIIDVKGDADIEAIKAIDGVVKVRAL